ncbi:MAG: hypothetical protein HYY53_00175, partial [candidate division NC10 bacterium]|nr:hypothetical protein [candidate division NC10 bacterium]
TGRIRAEEVVVCLATGNGLKDPKSALKVLPAPAVIEPTLQEVDKFLRLKLYEIRAAGAKNGDRHLMTEVPSKQAVTDLVREEFGVRLTPEYAQRVLSLVEGFVNKGKAVTKGDLQYILESVLRGLSSPDGVLKVEDFQVKTTLHGKAEAKVWVTFAGERLEGEAAGVGPVDAVINALKTLVLQRGQVFFQLADYQVEINTPGTHASVETTVVMTDAEQNRVVATGTSPDIIVASVKAFVEGYNLLWARQRST